MSQQLVTVTGLLKLGQCPHLHALNSLPVLETGLAEDTGMKQGRGMSTPVVSFLGAWGLPSVYCTVHLRKREFSTLLFH